MAEAITAALDYRGKPPNKQQQKQIADWIVAAFEAGWSVEQLAVYLDLSGQDVRYPAAVYLSRLDPARIPAPPGPFVPQARSGGSRGAVPPPSAYSDLTVDKVLFGGRSDTADGGMWERAMQRAQQKTAAMAGGGGHRPYSNDVWCRPADPAEAAKIPHCGHLDCDPTTRIRDYEDDKGFKFANNCDDCHPDNVWPQR